jgi:hypothetical protein
MENNKLYEKNYSWKKEQEHILKKWADKALCFKLMHERANKKYWCLNAWFNIPIIIISTITGTGNFATGGMSHNVENMIFLLGGLNICGAILATIATYTGIAQKIESHRVASIAWDKYSRKIQIELSKSRNDRINASDFVKLSADEFDRLIEISPILPNDIIRWFRNLIETGQFEETMPECTHFIYDCLCFPCGCNLCEFCHKNINNKDTFQNIELPEIIGKIKPTEIADTNEVTIQKNTDKNIELPEIIERRISTDIEEINEDIIHNIELYKKIETNEISIQINKDAFKNSELPK